MRSTDLICFILLGLCVLVTARPDKKAQCGYAGCPTVKPGMINVHLVPHTHDDVGWLKTVDQYFYGHRNSIQRAGVQYAIDSVVENLIRDPNKRFAWVETAFLWQWWQEQDETIRDKMRTLVNNGQFEITGGAWSMHDEAVTHYHSIIDQFTWGFRKVDELFGTCARPVIGWQIDPFGHARESASIMAQMGFDGLFFARLDYQDKLHRLDTKTTEMIWQASENLGESSWLFTHALYNHYSPPPGFCFDILCDDEPFIDNKRSPDYNVDERVHTYTAFAREQSKFYNSENIINLMGEDFHYLSADMWYKNMDKLIKYVNEQQSNGSNINVFYSSPSCYVKAVNEEGLTWTTKQDDFFPYPNDKNSYWTGYYTSRPTLKYFERKGNNLLQSVKQMYSLAELGPEEQWTDISSLREMMGVMQHHDAITGTEKQHVAEDYALRLHDAFVDAHNTAEKAINKLTAKSSDVPTVVRQPCLLSNISQCAASEESSTFVVTVYNPLSRVNSQYIRLPVPQNEFKVTDLTSGAEVPTQLVPIPQTVLDIPGRDSAATQELVFKADKVPALGLKSYYVEKLAAHFKASAPVKNKLNIGNGRLQANVNPETKLLNSVTLDDINIPLTQNFFYYEGAEGGARSSGAYVFRPRENVATPFAASNISTVTGDLVEEIHQTFGDWVSQVIRVYAGESQVEFEWQVGPIPVDDNIGKEIITRYATGWATDGIFYTDSNGRETLLRKRDFRPTWEVEISEPVSANYYPITTHIAIKGDGSQLSVLPDRAQGGSSINDGDIELMLHRRLLKDDEYGVSEPLNETAYDEGLVARGRHIVVFGSDSTSSPSVTAQQRQLSQSRMVLNPLVLLTPTSLTLEEWQENFNNEYSGLNTALPENIHILTLEPWRDNSILLRLEHYLEINDDIQLSQPADVVLEDLFAAFTITSAQEMTLGGNQNIEESARMSWNVEGFSNVKKTRQVPSKSNRLTVTLEPMQIRTFVIEVAPRGSVQQSEGVFSTFYQYVDNLKSNIFA